VVYTRVCGAEMLKYSLQYQSVSSAGVISGRAIQVFLPRAAEHCQQQEQAAETYGWLNRKQPWVR